MKRYRVDVMYRDMPSLVLTESPDPLQIIMTKHFRWLWMAKLFALTVETSPQLQGGFVWPVIVDQAVEAI